MTRYFALKIQLVSLLFAAAAIAQPSFEVASIKLNSSGDRSSFSRQEGDSLILKNWTLRDVVLKAYDLKNYALSAPDWLSSRAFDINAKAAGKITDGEMRLMLQSLLVERFQMKTHLESKELQAYALIPADRGLKLMPDQDQGPPDVDLSRFPDKTRIACRHCSMDQFAGTLADQVGRAVVDRSSAPGEFSFTFEWSPDQNAGDAEPSIFAALKAQLGMRLESRKVPISILVIDRINRVPTEN